MRCSFLRKGNNIAVIRGGKGCTYCRQNWTECSCWKVGSGKIIAQFVRRLSHLKIQSIPGCRRIERYYKLGIGGSAPHLPLRLPLVSHRDGRFPNAAPPQLNVSSVRSPPSLPRTFLPASLSIFRVPRDRGGHARKNSNSADPVNIRSVEAGRVGEGRGGDSTRILTKQRNLLSALIK